MCLDVGDDGKGGRGEFGVATVVGGEALEKLLQVGIGVEVSGGRSEGAKGAHGWKKAQERKESGVENFFPKFGGITL